jgi:hypothetical protein
MGRVPADLTRLYYLCFPTLAALDTPRGADELLAVAQAYECQLIVVDTISRAVTGEENENDTWLNLYRHTGVRLKAAGIALIRLDHSGKDISKGMRGGSAKYGDVDAVWAMRKLGDDTFTLDCTDHRFALAPEQRQIGVTRLDDPLRHKPDAQPATTIDREVEECVAEADRMGLPASYGSRRLRGEMPAGRWSKKVFEGAARRRKTVPRTGGTVVP